MGLLQIHNADTSKSNLPLCRMNCVEKNHIEIQLRIWGVKIQHHHHMKNKPENITAIMPQMISHKGQAHISVI